MRDKTIDIAKGIGILLVVLAHLPVDKGLRDFVYMFHMPLFFFLSGIFFSAKGCVMRVVKKRVIGLLIPYVVFMLMFIPLKYYLYQLTGDEYSNMLSHNYSNRPLWFLLVLFELNIIGLILFKMESVYKWLSYTSATFLAGVGYYLAIHGYILPGYVVRSLLCFSFFWVGYKCYRPILAWCDQSICALLLGIISVSLLVIGTCLQMDIDIMMIRIDPRPYLFYGCAIAGIFLILLLSKWLAGFEKVSNFFSFMGRNSLYIFAGHWPLLGLGYFLDGTKLPPPICLIIMFLFSMIASLGIGCVLHKLMPKWFHKVK